MDVFEHESLDPYPTATEFVALVDRLTMMVPPGRGYLVDELRQSAVAVVGNIAIGASEPEHAGQLRFLSEARRAAVRCAALLDVLRTIEVIAPPQRDSGREMLLQIVERLARLENALATEMADTKETAS
jgi:four helix bundle protein